MYAKTFSFALLAVWLFSAALATPVPEPEPVACNRGCGDCCSVSRCHSIPVSSCVPIKTTHRIINDCGCGGYGNGWGYGGWGNGGWGSGGCGCGCGCGGWGNGCWGNGGWGGCGCGCGGC